jgi:hypothetical protein
MPRRKGSTAGGLVGLLLSLLVAEKSGFQSPESPELAGLQALADEMGTQAVERTKQNLADGKSAVAGS